MSDTLLIVHGYSDGSTSFTALRDFFVTAGAYKRDHVFFVDYSSMDDQATFRDFASKLDADYEARFSGTRIDVACHSTGSLVVRAWLTLHLERARLRELDQPCPVHRLLCFAPANFGSDLAALGQSFLGKFRSTFFNSNSNSGDFMESGKEVLRGLEPASPFQWELSGYDLQGDNTYFSPDQPDDKRCYPFIFAASTGYTGLQAKLIPKRAMPGTDGTVRIAGTSLNTRKCTVDFLKTGPVLSWSKGAKFSYMPFCVFKGFNHGSIIDPAAPGFLDKIGPGTLALKALTVTTLDDYTAIGEVFEKTSNENYAAMSDVDRECYQQFFFRVRDDVDLAVEDYFVDFHVVGKDGEPDQDLTLLFAGDFSASFYRHSADPACRVMMVNCTKFADFGEQLDKAGAKVVMEIRGVSPVPDVVYKPKSVVVYDGDDEATTSFLFPNTTTLVDVVLTRGATDRLLQLRDADLKALAAKLTQAAEPLTGRAKLVAIETSKAGV
jgi:hypothetical protein